MMKVACADITFPKLTYEKRLSLIKMLGFDGVCISIFQGNPDTPHWADKQFADLKTNALRIRRMLDSNGLEAADLFLQYDANFADGAINTIDVVKRKRHRETFIHAVEFAQILGCQHISGLSGCIFDEKSFDVAVEELTWRARKAKEYGLICGTEFAIGGISCNPIVIKKLLDEQQDLSVTMDYSHFLKNGYSVTDVDVLLPYVSILHIRGTTKEHLQAGMNESAVNFSDVTEKLEKNGYSGWAVTEYMNNPWEGCDHADTVSESYLALKTIKNKSEV